MCIAILTTTVITTIATIAPDNPCFQIVYNNKITTTTIAISNKILLLLLLLLINYYYYITTIANIAPDNPCFQRGWGPARGAGARNNQILISIATINIIAINKYSYY